MSLFDKIILDKISDTLKMYEQFSTNVLSEAIENFILSQFVAPNNLYTDFINNLNLNICDLLVEIKKNLLSPITINLMLEIANSRLNVMKNNILNNSIIINEYMVDSLKNAVSILRETSIQQTVKKCLTEIQLAEIEILRSVPFDINDLTINENSFVYDDKTYDDKAIKLEIEHETQTLKTESISITEKIENFKKSIGYYVLFYIL